jgi:hypothetical protein
MQKDLSPAGRSAWAMVTELSITEKARILQALAVELANAVKSASTTTGANLEGALSTELESATSIKTASHGFSIVKAADGTQAVQFNKTLDDGTTVTFQLCEGARGTWSSKLAMYGRDKLNGAELKSHSDFSEMVDALLQEVKGLKVENGELQTDDKALKLAYQRVQEPVRRARGVSFATFETEETVDGRAVSGRRVVGDDRIWGGSVYRLDCAFFGVSSPE